MMLMSYSVSVAYFKKDDITLFIKVEEILTFVLKTSLWWQVCVGEGCGLVAGEKRVTISDKTGARLDD